jgi:hypothetical protein
MAIICSRFSKKEVPEKYKRTAILLIVTLIVNALVQLFLYMHPFSTFWVRKVPSIGFCLVALSYSKDVLKNSKIRTEENIKNMASVGFIIDNIKTDQITSFNGTSINSLTADELISADSSFWIERNEDGEDVLCRIGVTSDYIISAGTTIYAQDFIGGRPPRRPR